MKIKLEMPFDTAMPLLGILVYPKNPKTPAEKNYAHGTQLNGNSYLSILHPSSQKVGRMLPGWAGCTTLEPSRLHLLYTPLHWGTEQSYC